MRIFGIDYYLTNNGINFGSLLIFATIIGFGGSLFSLIISKWSAKFMTGAKVITSPKNNLESWLLKTISEQSKRARIGMPEVAIYKSNDINAFATGATKNSSLVAFSSGILEKMNKEELEAVAAHEVSHIANGDMVTLALIQGIINTFVFVLARLLGHLVDKVIFKNRGGHGPAFWITTIIAEIVLAILASIIVMWFSRQREFKADAGAAFLTNKNQMILALKKIKQAYLPSNLPDQIQAFGISGTKYSGIKKLFMSHPPIDERIKALEEL